MRKILLTLIALTILVGIAKAQEVTGKYRITYTNVTELTDTLQLDFAETISNATVTFSQAKKSFDNGNGGTWTAWFEFPISVGTDYLQIKVVVSGENVTVYDAPGNVLTSASLNGFWNNVQSDGDDIRAYDQNGQLYFWIQKFDYSNKTAVIWVKVVSSSSKVGIAYGNPQALSSRYNSKDAVFPDFMEVRRITLPQQSTAGEWFSFSFLNTFSKPPVVIAEPDQTFNGSQEMRIRLKNITTTGFDIRQQEPSNADDIHAAEEVTYVAVPEGDWITVTGVRISAGKVATSSWLPGDNDANQPPNQISFTKPFAKTPVILTQLQDYSYTGFAHTRVSDATTTGFRFAPEPQGSVTNPPTTTVTVGWLAVQQHVGEIDLGVPSEAGIKTGVTDAWATIAFQNAYSTIPNVIAWMMSYNGGDSAGVRGDALSTTGFSVKCEEDTTYDTETSHAAEDIGYFVIGGEGKIHLAVYGSPVSVGNITVGVENPKLILNGNVVAYNGTLSGKSVTLSIPSSYFVSGANNVTITSDNKAAMDVVIEFDYAFSATVNAIDYDVYYVKNSSVQIPANTVSATYTFYLPKRTADYKLSVLLNGANATYTKQDLPDSVKISIDLSPGNYSINSTIRYLLFNVSILDEVSLTPAKVNVSILDSNYVKLAEYTDASNFKIYGSKSFRYGNYFMKLSSGSTKDIYERTVTLVARKLNNTVKALVLDASEAAVSVIFQLNDPYNIYSGQAIIRVSKYVNGELYDVVSDKVDIENKISAILRYNDKYFISVIDWATGTEQTIGDFIAASSGTKIINAKSIEFNVTTVFDYIKYSIYETANAIVVHYEDKSQKTNSLTVEIRDDKGNLLFSQTSYQQKYDLVFNKTGATYYQVYLKADTQYGVIEETKIVGSPAGLLKDVIKLIPPESVTGYSQDFMMAALSFIVLLFFAALFSKRNNRTGALVTAVGAVTLWLFGWLPIDVGVLALTVLLAILGKLEEGYRK